MGVVLARVLAGRFDGGMNLFCRFCWQETSRRVMQRANAGVVFMVLAKANWGKLRDADQPLACEGGNWS